MNHKLISKKPWPTAAAMQQVYEKGLWGKVNTSDFYSGEGSHLPEIVEPYLRAVRAFLTSFSSPLIVCDLGCGDFNIGKQLAPHTKKYIAVDIVPELIAHNRTIFKEENIEFNCLDIAKDQLPTADCAIVRQVLQHLSNTEVLAVVRALEKYKHIIITEHIPEGDFIPNQDIISGQGTRLKKNSGLVILEPPFSFKIQSKKEMCSVSLKEGKGKIVTHCYTVS